MIQWNKKINVDNNLNMEWVILNLKWIDFGGDKQSLQSRDVMVTTLPEYEVVWNSQATILLNVPAEPRDALSRLGMTTVRFGLDRVIIRLSVKRLRVEIYNRTRIHG
jgi:hypothetical protein